MTQFTRRDALHAAAALALAPVAGVRAAGREAPPLRSWPLVTPRPTGIHDIAPAPDGGIWFTAQRSGHLGWFDPRNGRTELVPLGDDSAPHGVVRGPDGAAWITDSGLNAIVRVGWPDRAVRVFPLPARTPHANLNTGTFCEDGNFWFTGQSGVLGKVVTKTGQVIVKPAPGGRGPYGMCTTPQGEVWWCSLAGSFIARLDRERFESIVVEPPTRNQGARRVWSDSRGRIWVSEWSSGQLSMHDPRERSWREWQLPGAKPRAYAVYVDEHDKVWVSDFGSNAVLRFDPVDESFTPVVFPRSGAAVRQIAGRAGEVWLPESGTEHLSMVPSG